MASIIAAVTETLRPQLLLEFSVDDLLGRKVSFDHDLVSLGGVDMLRKNVRGEGLVVSVDLEEVYAHGLNVGRIEEERLAGEKIEAL